MADTRATPQKLTKLGVIPSYTAGVIVGTTDFIMKNDGRTFLHVKKGGAGACDVIIKTPATVAGLDVAELTVNVIATTGDKMIGPFPPNVFNDGNGDLRFNFSEVTGLTFAVLSM